MKTATSTQERPGQAAADEFCDALWLEDGLSKNTLEAYKRDLLLFADWLMTMIGFLLLITYVPQISLWLPRLVFGS